MKTTRSNSATEQIIRFVNLMQQNNLSSGTGGNIAIKCDDRIYVTPHGMGTDLQHDIGPDDIVVVDTAGNKIEGVREVSCEVNMHVGLLAAFPEASASIHTHPHYTTVFAYAEKEIPIITEAAKKVVGHIPMVEARDAGSDELARDVVQAIAKRGDELRQHGLGVLLACHGIVAVGQSINQAFAALEAAEEAARCALLSKLLV